TISGAAAVPDCRPRSSDGGLARLEGHPDPALRTQGDEPDRLNGVAGREPHPVALRDRGDDDLRFRQGKAVPDADARPAPERQIGEAMALRDLRRREPRGLEAFGLWPQIGI